jgi:adenylosuccinate lyase
MIQRYSDRQITHLFSDANKVATWQIVELAVTTALEKLGRAPEGIARRMTDLLSQPVNLERWYELERINHHDLNAFLEERLVYLPTDLHPYWHPGTTSYDTEEPAFALILRAASDRVRDLSQSFEKQLRRLASTYRYTPMYAHTHGQGAKMQGFGKRALSYLAEFYHIYGNLVRAVDDTLYSKLSGAVGNYGGRLSPELERTALEILGLKPFLGATQIMPRSVFVPLATQLTMLVELANRAALDLRLAARSGNPLYQEPFAKRQKGSSAMPHKKNPIKSEKVKGMERMAQGFLMMIVANSETWEERAIEQSSVERVAWPDLFHVTCHALTTMTEILEKLRVYPDHMARELHEARKCYASDEAKERLKEIGSPFGLSGEEAYRMVQLACFNVFEVGAEARQMRDNPPQSYAVALQAVPGPVWDTLEDIVVRGGLRVTDELEICKPEDKESPDERVARWNAMLVSIFADETNLARWRETFTPEYLLKHESYLYQEILST